MEACLLRRPASALLGKARTPGFVSSRGHKVFSRTKRALNIIPEASFLPTPAFTARPTTGQDVLIYNPPSSQASVFHTPFKFLPKSDPRRRANLAHHFASQTSTPNVSKRAASSTPAPSPTSSANPDASAQTDTPLPPQIDVPKRNPRYHLSPADAEEIRRLRMEDPVQWSIDRLAAKFDCSPTFILVVTARAPREHKEMLARKLERIKSRWGPIRSKAREDRRKRKEMLYRGEL